MASTKYGATVSGWCPEAGGAAPPFESRFYDELMSRLRRGGCLAGGGVGASMTVTHAHGGAGGYGGTSMRAQVLPAMGPGGVEKIQTRPSEWRLGSGWALL